MTWDSVTSSSPSLLSDSSTTYTYGPGGVPIEQVTGTTSLYPHSDQLGSTVLITNSGGTGSGTYACDAHGTVTVHAGSAASALEFDGQYADAESGLVYLRARYYGPATAQFLTRDPLAAITRSPYAYVNDNPLNNSDPTGLCGAGCVIGWIGLGVGAVGIGLATFGAGDVVLFTVVGTEATVTAALDATAVTAGVVTTAIDCNEDPGSARCVVDAASAALGVLEWVQTSRPSKLSQEGRRAG